jgi:hypothetical protein
MKTKDRAALDYLFDNHDAHETAVQNAFLVGVSWAQQWIDVTDELPADMVEVLVKCRNGKRTQFDVDYMWNGKFSRRANVTHWRPITIE